MLRRIGFVLALLCSASSLASAEASGPVLKSCRFSWTDATVTADFVTSFNLYVGTAQGGPYQLVGSVPATTATTYGPTATMCVGLPDGQKYAVVTAVNAAGTESGPSNEFPFVLLVKAPAAPAGVSVQP